jgi:hypothetical protein
MNLDRAELRQFYRQAVDMVAQATTVRDRATWDLHKCYSLASSVIVNTLGIDWFEEHIAPNVRQVDYFKADPTDTNEYHRFVSRVMELGELILNLHKVTEFEGRLDAIRNDRRGVEAGIGELMGGRFFKCLGVMFHFLPTSGRRQDDYDIEYVRTDGKLGRCEVKSKLQGTELSAGTIKNTLKDAKSQLPRGETGVVLLRIPEEWVPWAPLEVGVSRLRAVINAVEDWFTKEKTTRISSVVVLSSRTDMDDKWVYPAWYFQEYRNPSCEVASGLPKMPTNERGHCLPIGNWEKITNLVRQWSK